MRVRSPGCRFWLLAVAAQLLLLLLHQCAAQETQEETPNASPKETLWKTQQEQARKAQSEKIVKNPMEIQYQNEDKPHPDWNQVFKAYIMMGDGIFGTWTPEHFEEELQLLRDEGY